MDVYKTILNTIAEPILSLSGVDKHNTIEKLSNGNASEKLCGESLDRLICYVELTLQLAKEQKQALEKTQGRLCSICGISGEPRSIARTETLCDFCYENEMYKASAKKQNQSLTKIKENNHE